MAALLILLAVLSLVTWSFWAFYQVRFRRRVSLVRTVVGSTLDEFQVAYAAGPCSVLLGAMGAYWLILVVVTVLFDARFEVFATGMEISAVLIVLVRTVIFLRARAQKKDTWGSGDVKP